MVPLGERFSEYTESGGFNTLVNADSFIDEGVLLTKSGDLVTFLRMRGPDAESLEPEQLDASTARLRAAIEQFGDDYVVTLFWTKSSNSPAADEAYPDEVVNRVIANRFDFLRKRRGLSSFETILAVVRKSDRRVSPWKTRLAQFTKHPVSVLHAALSTRGRMATLRGPLERQLAELRRTTQNFIEQVKGDFSIDLLENDQAFRFLRRMLNPDRSIADAVRLKYDRFVDFFAVDSELACHHGHLRLGESVIRILTLKEPPAHTFAHLLRDLCTIPSDMAVIAEWHPCEMASAVRKVRSMRRHFHNTKLSLWSQVGSERLTEREMLFDDSKEGIAADLGRCLEAVEMEGLRLGFYSLTIMLLGASLDEVEQATAGVRRIIGIHDGMVNEETFNVLNAFCAALPGGYPYNLRKLLVTGKNHADISPWFVPSAGDPRDAFLGAPALIDLETEQQSLFHFSLHVGDVGHTAIFGPTSTGKSVLLNAFVAHAQKYQRPYTLIIDFGNSYGFLTQALGGSCISLRPDAREFRINPFALPPTVENLQFLADFTKLLIEIFGYRMTDAEHKDLYQAIEALYLLDPPQRRLQTIAMTVSRKLGAHLSAWIDGGQYGTWFDHAEDTVSYARFQYIDMEGMEKIGAALQPLLFYLLHRFDEVISSPALATVLKIAIVDEAWRFFTHPVTCRYIETAFRTWRKKNAAMLIATQSLSDLPGAETLRPVIDNCPTKILLPNPTLDAGFYGDVLQLSATEQEKIRQLVPRRQFLLKRDGLSKVLNLNLDPRSYWLFTNNPFEAQRRGQLVAEVGLEAALDILAGGT